MTPQTVIVPTADGASAFDLTALYAEVKSAFLADYADDPAVELQVMRNGDLAERDYLESLRHLSPERCAQVGRSEVEHAIKSQARLSLCNLVVMANKARRKRH